MKNIIKIHLNNKDIYKNKYNNEILSYELSNYILEETKGINIKQNIKFVVISDFNMTDDEKNNFVDMIRNNFGADISETINFSRKQLIANLLILFVGILFFILYSLLQNKIVSEFVLILGWVFLGEAICNFLYKGIENKYNIAKRKQIVNAKVFFE